LFPPPIKHLAAMQMFLPQEGALRPQWRLPEIRR